MKSLLKISLLSLFFAYNCALAISIDDFNPNGVSSIGPLQGGDSGNQLSTEPSALGSKRFLQAENISGIGSFTLSIINDGISSYLSHNQSNIKAKSSIKWNSATNFSEAINNYTGLGGLDFTEESNASAFILDILEISAPVNITVRIYNASDASGSTFYQATTLISTIGQTQLNFSSFTSSMGSVDFTNVGAVELSIDGSNINELNLKINDFKTNGQCNNLPLPSGSVFDLCGVCNGDNSACSDCNGIPNGPDIIGATCPTGLNGICADGVLDAGCTCISNQQNSAEVCDQHDNNCDGQVNEGLSCEVFAECILENRTDPYAAIRKNGNKQSRIVIDGIYTMRKILKDRTLGKAFLQKNKRLLQRNRSLIQNLPYQDLVYDANCAAANCKLNDNSQKLAQLLKNNRAWLTMSRQILRQTYQMAIDQCQPSDIECITSRQTISRVLWRPLRHMQNVWIKLRRTLPNLAVKTGSCVSK